MKKNKLLGIICALLAAPVTMTSCVNNPSTSQSTGSNSSSQTPGEGENEFVDVDSKDQEILNKMFQGEKIALDKTYTPVGTVKRVFKVGKEVGKETNCYVVSEAANIMGQIVNMTLYVHVVDGKVKTINHDGALTTDNYTPILPQLEEALQKYVGTDGSEIQLVTSATMSSEAINKLIKDAILADSGSIKNTYAIEIRHAPKYLAVGEKIELNVLYDVNNIRQTTLPTFNIKTSTTDNIKVVQSNNKITVEALKVSEAPVTLTLTHPSDETVSDEIELNVVATAAEKQNVELSCTTDNRDLEFDIFKNKYYELGFTVFNYDLEGYSKVDVTSEIRVSVTDDTVINAKFGSGDYNRVLNITALKTGTTKLELYVEGLEYTKLTFNITVTDSTPSDRTYTLEAYAGTTSEIKLSEKSKTNFAFIKVVDTETKEEIKNLKLIAEPSDPDMVEAKFDDPYNPYKINFAKKEKTGSCTVKVYVESSKSSEMTFTITVE